jgi:hypothetical protein
MAFAIKKEGEFVEKGFDRRAFLKLGVTSATLLPSISPTGKSPVAALLPSALKGDPLPGIPRPADLASARLVHHFRDYFNPPAAHNEWGYLQAAKSVAGITAILFPPFACCGVPAIRSSPGNLTTCEIFLNDRILTSYPAPAGQVAYNWYCHRIVRETEVEGLRFITHTFLPSKQRAVVELISVRNETGQRRKFTLGFDLRAGVAEKRDPSWSAGAPAEADNRLTGIEQRGCIIFEAQHSRAISVQGVGAGPSRILGGRMLVQDVDLAPGETRTFHYLNIIGDDRETALDLYDRLQARADQLLKENEEAFAEILRAAFTPGNSLFSGHLPQLITRDAALWKLYYTGFTNLLVNRRATPDSAYGTTYVTIPRFAPTLSYIWDAMLTSLSLALLDPAVLRSLLENWLTQDMHQHVAIDFLTGKGTGPWYGVNDMGILRCADNYLRVTGDFAWLDKPLEGKAVMEHLVDHALYWKKIDKYGHGLGDYGTLDNLLEVVSTWEHEVPAMNAGNVYGMRFVASLAERRGNSALANQMRAEAKDLAARINRLLYVDGKGWWKSGQPDGTFNEVRHAYDLLTILDTMFDDLNQKQKQEMSRFFWEELYTPLWMHALAPGDVDATWNVRADHSWLGAYTAWPSMTAKGLYKIDAPTRVASWVKGLAKSANQGPFGQAHMVESVFPTEQGGAFKCPLDRPYENDWCCVSGGSFMDLVIDTIFGAGLPLDGDIRVHSRLADFDPEAKLVNVRHQGKDYVIDRQGAKAA